MTSRRPRRTRRSRPSWRRSSLAVLAAFALLLLIAVWRWHVPKWVAAVYAVASLACFAAYAADKAAAVSGRWRVPERQLLVLGLIGGWPGAVVAQQWLNHKSGKASFQVAFWGSVVIHVATFATWLFNRAV